MSDYSVELAFALELASLGGRLAMHHFRRDPRTERKPDGSWVTEADWAVEAQIRLRIARTWPDHNVLGEEDGLRAAGGGPEVPDGPTWVIDPIDGTNNFIAGIPIWATLIALRVDDRSVLGVAHAPALNETYDAAIGLGARMNDQAIAVRDVERLDDAFFVYGGAEHFREKGMTKLYDTLIDATERSRGFGDFWGHMLVARGAAQLMVEPTLRIWDVAPLEPIVTEAGGRITNLNGEPFADGDAVVTSCGSIHDQILELA